MFIDNAVARCKLSPKNNRVDLRREPHVFFRTGQNLETNRQLCQPRRDVGTSNSHPTQNSPPPASKHVNWRNELKKIQPRNHVKQCAPCETGKLATVLEWARQRNPTKLTSHRTATQDEQREVMLHEE